MRIRLTYLIVLLALLPVGSVAPCGEEDSRKPAETDVVQKEDVRLVLIDTVVLDKKNRAVSGVRLDEFEVTVDGKPVDLSTLDVDCREGSLEDPQAVRRPDLRRDRPIPATENGRRLIIAIDYQHLTHLERATVLDQAKGLVKYAASPGDEIMIVALVGGPRIEQTFTADTGLALESLERMEYDITLWNPDFAHVTEEGLFASLAALFEFLENLPGPKAMVLYSSLQRGGFDSDYVRLASAANAARCPVYTVHAAGLQQERGRQLEDSLRIGHG